MIRFVTGLWAAVVPIVCCGCGLIFIPRIERLPGAIREIQVRDAETGAPLPDATVTFYVLPLHSEFEHDAIATRGIPGRGGVGGDEGPSFDPYVQAIQTEHPDTGLQASSVKRLQLVGVDEGRYHVRGRTFIRWSQCWWPLMIPHEGWTIEHGHLGAVVATAPGREWQNMSYCPVVPLKDLRRQLAWTAGLNPDSWRADAALAGDGVLVFHLHRLPQDPTAATRAREGSNTRREAEEGQGEFVSP